jgi:N-acetylneuraminic acid mutarotase
MPGGGGNVAVTVYNGLIYTFGGSGTSWQPYSNVYAYNPQTNTWTSKQNMPTARYGLQTYLVGNKIYAIGGSQAQYTSLAKVEVYYPDLDKWEARADMPFTDYYFASAVVNNKIYVIGGTPDGATGVLNIWEYDPTQDPSAQNGWIQKADIPTQRGAATAAVVDGKIYLIGGYVPSTGSNYATNEMYDPTTNSWQAKQPMPTPRGFINSAVLNGKIYVIAGGYPTATKKLEVYDPVQNSWMPKKDLNVARVNARAAVYGGKIYVFAGYPNITSCEYYDPVTDTWTYFSNFPESIGGTVSVAVYNNLIYVFGGGYQPGIKKVYAYNPQTDTWTPKSDMWTQRTVAQACLVNGKIYVMGGALTYLAPTAANEMYEPSTDTWWIKSNLPYPSAWLSCAVVNDKIYVFEGTPDWSTGGVRTWVYDPALDPVNILVPVELTTFTVAANGREVTLCWSTATELNNQGFEVQRKFGSNDFVTIGSVKGNGTTTAPNNYTYVDRLIDAGKYFYRLKQIEYGGKYEYSQSVEVNWSPFTTYKLEQNYPNPFNPTTTIGFGIADRSHMRLSILNILGEEIKILLNEEKEAGYHSIDFNASNLPSGVYFYKLVAKDFISTKKMMLVK